MGALLLICAALGTPVFGAPDKVEFLLGMLALLLALVGLVGSLIFRIFRGVTRGMRGGASFEPMRTLEDLGPLRRTFTNYTPWRMRAGVSLVVVGAACGVIGYFADYQGLLGLAGVVLLFGIPTLLYVAFLRVDRLDLHDRGFVFRQGKAKATGVYYSEIEDVILKSVDEGYGPTPIALEIALQGGGTIQIGNTFFGLGKAYTELSALCKHSDAPTEDPASGQANAAGRVEEKGVPTRRKAALASEPRWRVVGTEEPSGKEVVREIPAPSADEAMASAILDGMNVTNIERIG
jgi:hypothetical protein